MNNTNYEPLNRKTRASQLRKDAQENHDAGFPGFAQVAWETAAMIDPWIAETPEA